MGLLMDLEHFLILNEDKKMEVFLSVANKAAFYISQL
jgi:hypothetical protein